MAGSGGKATADDIPPTPPPPPLADFRRTHVLRTMLLPTSEEAGLIDMAEEEELEEEEEETWVVPESAGETARDRPGRLRTATAVAEDDASSIMVRSLSRAEPPSSPSSPRRRSVEEDRLLPASEQLGRDSSVSAAAVAVSVVVLD